MPSCNERVAARDIVARVIGPGYVGLPLAEVFCEAGSRVFRLDVDSAKVALLSRAESFISRPPRRSWSCTRRSALE
jgi:UDP-N-acetyl-D-mannosaminuronate dehydrogenase